MHRYSFQTAPVAHPEAVVGGTGQYRFTVLTDGLLRYEWADDGCFEDRASVFAINRQLPVPEFRLIDQDDSLQIITSRFHLTYNKQPFCPSGLHAGVKGFFHAHSSVWRYGKANDDLGGTARTLDEADGAVPLESGVVSRSGYTTMDDSKSMLFDENQWLATRRPGNRIDGYLFAYGHDYRGAVQALYRLSGAQPVLPRWTLGNWWSRYYAYRDEEYLALMDRFAEKNIPMSVAVLDMDWHLVKTEAIAASGVTGWTGYTWDRELFPDPEGFLAELHKRGLRVSLNDHPADGVQSYEEPYEEMARAMGHDTSFGDPIAFDCTNQTFMDATFDVLHRKFEDQGVDLWWVDWQQGEHSRTSGIDPLWVLNHFHFLDSARGGKRPLTFSRYAGPGSHRYPVGFSGDTHVSWESLDFQPYFTSTASNIGYGWWSHDIGGHMHGATNHELLIRWVQYGVFSPIFRLHSSSNPWNPKEPWNLEIGHEIIMSDYMRLRHRLIPYLHSMNVRSAQELRPLVEPMYWSYPRREEAYNVRNQYTFGSELFVAPITRPRDLDSGHGSVLVWFPPGRHVDIFSGRAYDGNRQLWVSRRLADYPVFAREGAIIPLDGAVNPCNHTDYPEAIEVLLVVGQDGAFDLVEGDGMGPDGEEVAFARTAIRFTQETGTVEIGPGTSTDDAVAREWSVRLVGVSELSSEVELVADDDSTQQPVVVEKTQNGVLLRLGSHSPGTKLVLTVGANPQVSVTRPEAVVEGFLSHAQIDLDLKERIWEVMNGGSMGDKVGSLIALGLSPSILHPLLEALLADARGYA